MVFFRLPIGTIHSKEVLRSKGSSPTRRSRPRDRDGKQQGESGMAQIVRCDVCGKVYSQSYLGSHKRLSHGKRNTSAPAPKNDREAMELIVRLYSGLSDENKREVRKLLS
jgi:hypothetical protein